MTITRISNTAMAGTTTCSWWKMVECRSRGSTTSGCRLLSSRLFLIPSPWSESRSLTATPARIWDGTRHRRGFPVHPLSISRSKADGA